MTGFQQRQCFLHVTGERLAFTTIRRWVETHCLHNARNKVEHRTLINVTLVYIWWS